MNHTLKFRSNLWSVAAFVVAIPTFAFYLALLSASGADSLFDWSTHAAEVLDKVSQAHIDAGLIRLVYTNLLSTAEKFTRDRQIATVEVGSFDGIGMTVIYINQPPPLAAFVEPDTGANP